MKTITQLIQDSTLIQGSLTIGVTCVACYLWLVGQPVPEALMGLVGAAWGFYFRSKAGNEVRKNVFKDLTSAEPTPH